MPRSLKSSLSSRSSMGRSKSPRPSHHANDSGTSFRNPWPSAGAPTWTELAQGSFPLGWYGNTLHKHEHARKVDVATPDWGVSSLRKRQLRRSDCIVGTWLGHAGALVELPLAGVAMEGNDEPSAWLLFDPIFSSRAGPTGYTGPSRLKKTPCQIADLPGCDAVFISHSHYDHLDLPSIKSLIKKFPKARYYVPLGLRDWLVGAGVPRDLAVQLDWWQSRELSLDDLGHQARPEADTEPSIRLTCVPAQHNSGRTGVDAGSTLWCGWIAERFLVPKDRSTSSEAVRKGSVYHSGDTGYRRSIKSDIVCPIFNEIGDKFGPFDMSFIPIWRGGTLGFISYFGLRLSHEDIPASLHVSPADAIAIHKDVKSLNTIGIHFGTFIGSENESYEAIIEFAEACKANGISHLDGAVDPRGRAGIVDIGGSLAVEIG